MKGKILLAVMAIMIAAGSLVGCNAMKQGMDEVMPSDTPSAQPTASSTAGN